MNLPEQTKRVQRIFGVEDLSHVEDFVALLTYPLGAWQAQNWDPKVSSTGFTDFCDDLLGRASSSRAMQANQDSSQHPLIISSTTATSHLQNYASYIRENVIPFCRTDKGQTIEQCFGTYNASDYQQIGLEQTWRCWTWQYCTGAFHPFTFCVEAELTLVILCRMGLFTECRTSGSS